MPYTAFPTPGTYPVDLVYFMQVYRLFIRATDGGSPAKFTYQELMVRVDRAAPRFNQSVYNVFITRNTELQSVIFVLTAEVSLAYTIV